MATYYVELDGGQLAPKTTLKGGDMTPKLQFEGAVIYPTSGGGGSVTLQTKSVTYTPSTSQQTDQVTPDAGYDGLDKVNVTVDAVASGSVVVDTKTITVSSPFSFNANTGKISSHILNTTQGTATVTPGYVDSATPGDINVYTNKDQQLDTVGATTYTPSTTDQTIPAQKYLTGAQTILGDADLVAGNIKKDVNIFGVVGTYEGSGVDVSNDTVTADTLAFGYTAHMADGTAITGTRRFWVEITISTDGAVTQALDPYTLYHFTGNLTSLTITLNAPATGQIAHYHFDFVGGSGTPATLSLPNSVIMPDTFVAPDADIRYEIDILNNYGTIVEWS